MWHDLSYTVFLYLYGFTLFMRVYFILEEIFNKGEEGQNEAVIYAMGDGAEQGSCAGGVSQGASEAEELYESERVLGLCDHEGRGEG